MGGREGRKVTKRRKEERVKKNGHIPTFLFIYHIVLEVLFAFWWQQPNINFKFKLLRMINLK